jgi:hypothetical protein
MRMAPLLRRPLDQLSVPIASEHRFHYRCRYLGGSVDLATFGVRALTSSPMASARRPWSRPSGACRSCGHGRIPASRRSTTRRGRGSRRVPSRAARGPVPGRRRNPRDRLPEHAGLRLHGEDSVCGELPVHATTVSGDPAGLRPDRPNFHRGLASARRGWFTALLSAAQTRRRPLPLLSVPTCWPSPR